MKKIITMLVLILVLITACSPVKNTQETASDTKVSQPVADELQDYETLNKELNTDDLDSLDQDLDFSDI